MPTSSTSANDSLRIEELTLKNDEIIDYYRDLEEQEACEDLQKALLLGTVAMKSMKVTEKVDYIQKEFNKLDESFRVTLEDTVRELDEYLGENGELPKKIEELFGEDGKIIRELFDPNRDGTPLNKLKHEIIRTLADLIMEREKEKAKPTEIGGDFEDFVEEGLNDIISSRRNCCDVLRNTANETGLMDTTTGDFVIEVEGREKTKLVIEVKDWQSIDGFRIK
ncbi:MAG: hypothetical protein ACLFVB_10555, partial [Thermoplasmata archaeon]